MALAKHIEAAAERAMAAAEALRVAERDREEAYEAASQFALDAMIAAVEGDGPPVVAEHDVEEFGRLNDALNDARNRLLLARVKAAAS